MIVVTGAAGFIGSCVAARLNTAGHNDLILVDHIDSDEKKKNLEGKKYLTYLDKRDFLAQVATGTFDSKITSVIHMGACSSTVLQDAQYFEENNFQYTKVLAQWTLKHDVRFIYASSAATYGDGLQGYSDDHAMIPCCKPLNLYGQSKQKFDRWALDTGALGKIVGLKFFNVFGPNEYHKGEMRSVIAKTYDCVAHAGKIALFKSYKKEYADGEQKRDFIYVKDAVDVVMFFVDNPTIQGIYNVGTGKARTWNDVANALFAVVGKEPCIEYIEMPEGLREQYQYFTEADMGKLGAAGYKKTFTELEDAVKEYAEYLKGHSYI